VDEHLEHTRTFFGARAHGWDERFPDDAPVYDEAVGDLQVRAAQVVVDLGSGTGRALPSLRRAAGPDAIVLGIDVTPEMLDAARSRAGHDAGALLLADVRALPLRAGRVDAFFAAGIVCHVPDPRALFRELAAAAAPGARLAVFHPIGRAALAHGHQRTAQPDELLDPGVLPGVLAECGWHSEHIDDSDRRYFAIARLA
jgi:SAM-dependent methyltransferase